MEPWTDGAPLVFTSELLQTSYSGDGASDILGLVRRPWFSNQNSYKLRTLGMELWTDGAPLIFKSESLWNLKFEDGGAPNLNQISYKLRTAGMEPWTDGAPLMF